MSDHEPIASTPRHPRNAGAMKNRPRAYTAILSTIALLLLAGCGSDQLITKDIMSWSAERKRQNIDAEDYVLQPGDQIDITFEDYPEFNVSAVVQDRGSITIPLVGDISVEGITRGQLSELIVKRLSGYVTTSAVPVIKIKGALEQKVIVLGSVTGQGSYAATVPVSAFQALAMAGGPSSTADLRNIRVFRGGDTESTVDIDLSASLASLPGHTETIPLVYPGDLMYVPKEENVIRDFADLLRDVIVLFGIFAIVR